MAALVGEAMDGGALGFSTSRSFLHTVPDGRPIPGTYARPDELAALAGAWLSGAGAPSRWSPASGSGTVGA